MLALCLFFGLSSALALSPVFTLTAKSQTHKDIDVVVEPLHLSQDGSVIKHAYEANVPYEPY
jgi:hypothetical protein